MFWGTGMCWLTRRKHPQGVPSVTCLVNTVASWGQEDPYGQGSSCISWQCAGGHDLVRRSDDGVQKGHNNYSEDFLSVKLPIQVNEIRTCALSNKCHLAKLPLDLQQLWLIEKGPKSTKVHIAVPSYWPLHKECLCTSHAYWPPLCRPPWLTWLEMVRDCRGQTTLDYLVWAKQIIPWINVMTSCFCLPLWFVYLYFS